MNKYKKNLIELLYPYMDKTLTKWCLIFWIKPNEYDEIITETVTEWEYKTMLWYLNKENNKGDYEILWHLWMMAVFKYIRNKWFYCINNMSNDEYISIIKYYNEDEPDFECIEYIPNKELHLYSDEELKDLYLKLKEF